MRKRQIQRSVAGRTACYAAVLMSMITHVYAAGPPVGEKLGLPIEVRKADARASGERALGERLFFDKRFSADRSISCASCHQPNRAFTDGLAKARGLGGRLGTRNAPSLYNASLTEDQFWDGRQRSLESQAPEPFVNPVEHGLRNYSALLTSVRQDAAYAREFKAVFGVSASAIGMQHVAKALATFERGLAVGNSAFDRYYYGHDKSALSVPAARGLIVFTERAQCINCHSIESRSATFTDGQFHSLHIGMPRIEKRLAELTQRVVGLRNEGHSVAEIVLSDGDIAELGRFVVTLSPADIGKFRTPSLRNVALTAPYMHDGSVDTLEAAVDQEIYYRTAQSGRPLILTPQEKADLIAFLTSLTSQKALSTDHEMIARTPERGPANTRRRNFMR